jgi:hypothetical protein
MPRIGLFKDLFNYSNFGTLPGWSNTVHFRLHVMQVGLRALVIGKGHEKSLFPQSVPEIVTRVNVPRP